MSAAPGGSSPGTILIGFLIWAMIVAAYFTPSIIALIRRVPNAGSVVVIDLLLGWSVVGWIVALAMACRSKPRLYGQPGPGYPPDYYPPQPRP